MAESFSSRVVAVSGAAQAVGRAIAERFAEAGAKVYLIDRDEAALSAALKASGSVALRADPCDAGALEQAFSEIGRVGRLDAYVHAPYGHVVKPAEEIAFADFRAALDNYLAGAFAGSRLAGRLMLGQGNGAIVHIASIDAIAPRAGHALEAAVQAGLLGLTRALGIEWSARGVRVNAIAQGVIEGNPDSRTEAAGRYVQRTPLGRFGRPNEVAEAALFLASDEAKFITAETLRVDGGWLAYSYFYPAVANSEHR